jgi:hypothetical protein
MMNQLNPELESQLDALAQLCCKALKGESDDFADRSDQLLKSLLMSGFKLKSDQTLMVEVERRIKDLCPDFASQRGGETSSMTRNLEKKFERLAKWESDSPKDHSAQPPSAINQRAD